MLHSPKVQRLLERGLKSSFRMALASLLLFVGASSVALAQSQVSGTVTDSNGEPLAGAAVMVYNPGSTVSIANAVSNIDGKYAVNASEGQTLNFTFVGMKDLNVTVGKSAVINVTMQSDDLQLNETVVVGYGVQKKVDLTGSVATVDSKTLNARPIIQSSTALQGMVSGVTVTTATGSPGADGGTIRIRGINSFGGSSTSPLVLIDGVEGDMDSVDPALIESISVLKDAASSAMYGSRAANGVILITTKRGNTDKASVSYSGFVGWSAPTTLPDVVNAVEFLELTNAMDLQDGKTPTYSDEYIATYRANAGKDPDLYPDTDWQKAVLTRNGFTHNHTVSLALGTEKVKMLTTFGYVDQGGLVQKADYKRYSFRNNLDVKFNDKLSMKLDLSFYSGLRNRSPYESSVMQYMSRRAPDIPNQFSTGLYNGGSSMFGMNSEALLKFGGDYKTETLNFTGAATLTYKPLSWLTLQGMIAPKFTTTDNSNYKKSVETWGNPEGTGNPFTSIPKTQLTKSNVRSLYGNYNFIVSADKDFGFHNIKGTLGVERNNYDYRYLMAFRQGFDYDYSQIDAGNTPDMNNGGHRYQWDILSYFGRVNYNYKEKYLIEANMRIDGSSRFTAKNRWGYFPSVSAGWRISEEPFMAPVKKVLTNLKVRASYGSLGNQNLAGGEAASYYPTTQNLATGQISMMDNIYPIVTLNTMANEDLKWEKTSMLDVGVDFSLFSKIYVTADYYHKITDDILMTLDIPLGIGLNAPYQNAGKVRNNGWEVSVGYNDQWGDFTFGAQLNLSDVQNKILNMNGKTSTSGVLHNAEGHSIGSIWTLKSLGIIRTQEEADWVNANCPQFGKDVQIGDIRYADIDGNNKIEEIDREYVGSTIPRYTYSGNFNFGWKGISLNVLLQGVGKVDGYLHKNTVQPSAMGLTFRKEHLDWASAENPDGKTPRLTSISDNNWYNSSFWMKSAAYLRIKNITLGYNLPQNWVKKIGLQSCYVYATGQNLFTFDNFWQGYDPEIAYRGSSSGDYDIVDFSEISSYPVVKTWTLGLQIKF